MAIRVIPKKFKANDGAEFATEIEAQRHEELLEANRNFEKARRVLCHSMVKTYKTADGHPFEFDTHKDYFTFITYYGWPELRKIGLWGWYDQKFEMDGTRLKVVVGDGQLRQTFDVADLYRTEAAAREELLKRRREHIAGLQSRGDK